MPLPFPRLEVTPAPSPIWVVLEAASFLPKPLGLGARTGTPCTRLGPKLGSLWDRGLCH